MTEDQKLDKLKSILEPYVQNKEAFIQLNENTHFMTDLEINSANLVDVILDVEDEFDIEIDNESMEKMATVKDAISIINSKLAS